MTEIRRKPCTACPYRTDVPSGIWAREEYDKLPPYDAETFAQPVAGFSCHTSPEFFCHGWALVHMNRGHNRELLALRFRPAELPPWVMPLFKSGQAAADHGKADVDDPDQEALEKIDQLLRRHPRLT